MLTCTVSMSFLVSVYTTSFPPFQNVELLKNKRNYSKKKKKRKIIKKPHETV